MAKRLSTKLKNMDLDEALADCRAKSMEDSKLLNACMKNSTGLRNFHTMFTNKYDLVDSKESKYLAAIKYASLSQSSKYRYRRVSFLKILQKYFIIS